MITATELSAYLNDFLSTDKFRDYCPNGLQVQGRSRIQKIVTGVTACQALIDQAIAQKADAILVHHGYFWKGELAEIVGLKRNRIASLLAHDINLFAYHLPLDAHLKIGNNMQLAKKLNITVENQHEIDGIPNLLWQGCLETAMPANELCAHIQKQLGQMPLHVEGNNTPIKTIAWCTGAAQDFIEHAYALNCDAFITGEVSERTVHIARENNRHFFGCGHHATERYGVQALGEHLTQKFQIETQFIDIPNPV